MFTLFRSNGGGASSARVAEHMAQPQLSPDMAQPAMDQFLAAAFKYTSSAVSRYAGRCLSKIAAVTYPILSSYR